LTEINPAGEKESTGLVTRFTMRPSIASPPPGFPVTLRLLSETDIIKILGNTYFNDGDQTKEDVPSAEDLEKLLAALKNKAAASSGMTEDDVMDIQDYFLKHFVGNRLLDILSHFWRVAAELASTLDVEGRATLFSLLWGRHAKFTRLYVDLVRVIETLGRAADAYAPIDALRPRETSIIDVATLADLGNGSESKITIQTQTGKSVTAPRSLIAALTAELRIEMFQKPRQMFELTDLLDFPGARSRQKLNLSQFMEEKSALAHTFLRGKVAYLFDRYVAEQELTAMLLCIKPSAQEVVTLPDMIDDWIAETHGRTPQTRSGHPTVLFFVLTWFDTHFVDRAGDINSPSGRFKARLDASLLGYFGRAHSWPREWTPGRPFDNCYWFRNPNYPAKAIIQYEGRRETGFVPQSLERVKELKEGFLSLSEAKDHFRDPNQAFEAGLKLNDGGISYIVENLEAVCRPELKSRQIRARIQDLKGDLASMVERFYVSMDVETRLAARREAAYRVFDALEGAVARGTFATVLRMLMVDPLELSEIIYAVLRTGFTDPSASGRSNGASRTVRVLSRLGIVRPGQKRVPEEATVQDVPRSSPEVILAQHAIDAFIGKLRSISENDLVARNTGIPRDELKEIVDELIALVIRSGLESRVASKVKLHLGTPKPELEHAARVALVASTEINRMMGDFGFHRMADKDRPEIEVGENHRRAFATRPIVFDASGLGSEPKSFGADYVSDWFAGFYRIIEQNATAAEGVQVDIAQNQRLKTILDGLKTTSA
jgi:hypothetical protein